MCFIIPSSGTNCSRLRGTIGSIVRPCTYAESLAESRAESTPSALVGFFVCLHAFAVGFFAHAPEGCESFLNRGIPHPTGVQGALQVAGQPSRLTGLRSFGLWGWLLGFSGAFGFMRIVTFRLRGVEINPTRPR